MTFNISAVVACPLARRHSGAAQPGGWPFSILKEEQLLEFSQDPSLQLVDTRIKDALARNDFCVGAIMDGNLIAYAWRSFSATPHDKENNIWVDFRTDCGYGHHSLTLPAYRGQHIMSSLYAFADNCCLDKGKTYAIGYVDTDNYPAIRATLRAGYRIVGYAGYLLLFGRFFSFSTPGSKKYGFRFFRRQH